MTQKKFVEFLDKVPKEETERVYASMVKNDEKIFDLDKFLQALYKVSQSQINKKEPHGPPSGPPENPQILNSDHRAFISLIINHLRMS